MTPQDMIDAIEAALLANPAGVVNVRYADGRSVQFDRKQALAELGYWQNQKAMQASSGLVMSRMSLKGDA